MNLEPGAVVKLHFTDEDDHEAMWVRVTEVRPGGYVGVLDSRPMMESLAEGDAVIFEPRHVTDIWT